MRLFRTSTGGIIEEQGRYYQYDQDWDALIRRDDLAEHAIEHCRAEQLLPDFHVDKAILKPPLLSQEVWAAGVTYFRSRSARMEESKGGGDFYDRVYNADRPELFLKATPARVVGHRDRVRIRRDSHWNVPEPELALLISASGKITGYTIGNDMSSRDIEGENPLYLPQAKCYDRCCSLGPGILVTAVALPSTTAIELRIERQGQDIFTGHTSLEMLKRTPSELAAYLYRETSFPAGCFLLTGTGIVPPDEFTLQPGDVVRITIEPIGTLINTVEQAGGRE